MDTDYYAIYDVHSNIKLINKSDIELIATSSNLIITFLNFDGNRGTGNIDAKFDPRSLFICSVLSPFRTNILLGAEIFKSPKLIPLPLGFRCICYKEAHKNQNTRGTRKNLSTTTDTNVNTQNIRTEYNTHTAPCVQGNTKVDRTHERGRGTGSIFVAIRNCIADEFEHFPTINSECSPFYDWVIHIPTNTVIGVVYVPPFNPHLNHCTQIYNAMSKDCTAFILNNRNIIISGDFNAKIGETVGDIHKSVLKTDNDFAFIDFIKKYGFINLNGYYAHSIYTRKYSRSIIDYTIILVNNDKLTINNFITNNGIDHLSDHYSITAFLSADTPNTDKDIEYMAPYIVYPLYRNNEKLQSAVNQLVQTRVSRRNKGRINKHPANEYELNKYYRSLYCDINDALIDNDILKMKKKIANNKEHVLNSITRHTYLNQSLNKILLSIQANTTKLAHTKEQDSINAIKLEIKNLEEQYSKYLNNLNDKIKNDMINKLEDANLYGNSKETFQIINRLNQNNSNKPIKVDGNLTTNSAKKCDAWYKYYSNLFDLDKSQINPNSIQMVQQYLKSVKNEPTQYPINTELNKKFTNIEVFEYVNSDKFRKKLNKAWGLDQISNKFIYYLIVEHGSFTNNEINANYKSTDPIGDKYNISIITNLFNNCLECGTIPDNWRIDKLINLPKSDDSQECNQFRGISLQSTLYKLLDALLTERINNVITKLICNEQGGFQHNKGAIDQLIALRGIILHYKNREDKPLFICFLDFSKAFDTVWHDGLLYKLHKNGINGKVWNLIDNIYRKIYCTIDNNKILTDLIHIRRGIRQGGISSPVFFNLFINDLIKLISNRINPTTGDRMGVSIGDQQLSSLLFADDVALLAENIDDMQSLLNICAQYAYDWGLKFNPKKCQLLAINTKTTNKISLNMPVFHNTKHNNATTSAIITECESAEISVDQSKAEGCKYLGVIEKTGNTYIQQRQRTVKRAKAAMFNIQNTDVIGHGYNINLGITLYTACVKSIIMYASEAIKISNTAINDSFEPIQHQTLCYILGCCRSSSRAFTRLMCGIVPILAQWHINRLKYFFKLLNTATNSSQYNNNIAAKIIKEDHKLYLNQNKSQRGTFTDEIMEILMTYDLGEYITNPKIPNNQQLNQPNNHPAKPKINAHVTKMINKILEVHYQNDINTITQQSTMQYFLKYLTNTDQINNKYTKPSMIEAVAFSNNREGVKWLMRCWSGKIKLNWLDQTSPNQVYTCPHCQQSMRISTAPKHIINTCAKLYNERMECNIDPHQHTVDIMTDQGCNTYYLIKYLDLVMDKKLKIQYYENNDY